MENTVEQNISTNPQEAPAEEQAQEQSKGEAPVEGLYSKAEVDSMIARSISEASKKWKEKQAKTSDERITALEQELARRDNQDYARSQAKEHGIDVSLAPLLYSGSEEETDAKLTILNTYLKSAVTAGVEARLKECKPIQLHEDSPATSTAPHKRKSLAERQRDYDLSKGSH